MGQAINRVEADINQWRQKEDRFSKMFSFNVTGSRTFLKEKLTYYHAIAARYKNSASPDEKLMLRLLRQERNSLEKQLYPNLFLRLLRKLAVAPVKQQSIARQETKASIRNEQALKDTLDKAGFGQLKTKLEEGIRQGLQEFTIPLSYYVNEKERMDFQLAFAKDPNGQYQFENYKAALRSENKSEEYKQQTFHLSKDSRITANDAYNLLAGRALQQESSLDYAKQNRWIQLNFTDKDAAGNYRFKEFHPGYGYDLKQTLQQLPLKENQSQEASEKLMVALLSGNRQTVSFLRDGRERNYFIEANPQFKSVTIYDEYSKKISMATALGQKAAEATQVAKTIQMQEHTGKAKKNGLSVG